MAEKTKKDEVKTGKGPSVDTSQPLGNQNTAGKTAGGQAPAAASSPDESRAAEKNTPGGNATHAASPPAGDQPKDEAAEKSELRPLEALAKEARLKGWETAGLMRAANWATGKQVSREEFIAALAKFRNRRQGGGRI